MNLGGSLVPRDPAGGLGTAFPQKGLAQHSLSLDEHYQLGKRKRKLKFWSQFCFLLCTRGLGKVLIEKGAKIYSLHSHT